MRRASSPRGTQVCVFIPHLGRMVLDKSHRRPHRALEVLPGGRGWCPAVCQSASAPRVGGQRWRVVELLRSSHPPLSLFKGQPVSTRVYELGGASLNWLCRPSPFRPPPPGVRNRGTWILSRLPFPLPFLQEPGPAGTISPTDYAVVPQVSEGTGAPIAVC